MTLQEFINKWNGRFCEYNGDAFKFQCVDLVRQYIADVLKYPQSSMPPANYAKNIFKNFVPNKYFSKVINTPTNSPMVGDIIFWGTYPFVTGIAGHVAICTGSNTYKLISFSQNYPTGSPCRYYNYNYRGVLGWLHPIK